jgi:hypothetical protein
VGFSKKGHGTWPAPAFVAKVFVSVVFLWFFSDLMIPLAFLM